MQNNINAIWKIASSQIQLKISDKNFKVWFSKIKLINIDENVVTISCPNAFTSDFIQSNYLITTQQAISNALGKNVELAFTINKEIPSTKNIDFPIFENTAKEVEIKKNDDSNLNPKYKIDNFVVGQSNRIAHAAALAIIQNPGQIYNPFFIYGGVGLGKTHLMQAIGNSLAKSNNANVLYISSEAFLNELVDAIQRGKTDNFRKKYRERDVLIIDDIQFISGKQRTQEEFFHIFNTLQQANKQIILASDRPPKDIQNLEERLVSRFEGGMVADIEMPDEETRLAILKKKCEEKNFLIDEDIVKLIADGNASNIRELEGLLTKLIANQNIIGKTLNKEEAAKIIGVSFKKKTRRLKPQDVINIICERFGVSQKEIKGQKRTSSIVLPRQVAMYILRTELNLSLIEVANIIRRKDHTTVIHAVDKIENMISSNTELKHQINEIRDNLR